MRLFKKDNFHIKRGSTVLCVKSKAGTEKGKEYKVRKANIIRDGRARIDVGIKTKHHHTGKEITAWQLAERFVLVTN